MPVTATGTLEPLAERLRELLSYGSIPASALSARQCRRLSPLFDSGVLEEERAGAGRRITVQNRQALAAFSRKLFPSGFEYTARTPGIMPRAHGVLAFRDAKTARTTWAEPVLLRGFGAAVLSGPGGVLPAAELSMLAGLAAIRLEEPFAWGFSGSVAVAENLEFFLSFEAAGLKCDLVIYAGGRLSDRVIAWLASPLMEACSVIHCGDYDPAGLQEYLRLREAMGSRAGLYVPDNIERLLKKYGRAGLVRNQAHILSGIRSCAVPEVLDVLDIIERYGLGLEQEVLLLAE